MCFIALLLKIRISWAFLYKQGCNVLIIKDKSMLVVIVTMSSGFARTFRLNIALILSTLFELCCRVSKQAARERINRKGREKLINNLFF